MIKTYVSPDLVKLQTSCCFHKKYVKLFSNNMLFIFKPSGFFLVRNSQPFLNRTKPKVSMFLMKPLRFTGPVWRKLKCSDPCFTS